MLKKKLTIFMTMLLVCELELKCTPKWREIRKNMQIIIVMSKELWIQWMIVLILCKNLCMGSELRLWRENLAEIREFLVIFLIGEVETQNDNLETISVRKLLRTVEWSVMKIVFCDWHDISVLPENPDFISTILSKKVPFQEDIDYRQDRRYISNETSQSSTLLCSECCIRVFN